MVAAAWSITGVLISVAHAILSVVLLVYYFRIYRKLQKANVQGFLSLPFFFRLLAFALYQNTYEILTFTLIFCETSTGLNFALQILQSLYPTMAFCILGLHSDILQLWFPCWWKRTQWTAISNSDF
ncbi:hypothetical protein K439DRAFT_430892 [Ramaria rubella]|nr:hypothetical protein K439DRAFT_430892 [Ramaria rubella]